MPVSPLSQNGLGMVTRLLVHDWLMLSPRCNPLTLRIADVWLAAGAILDLIGIVTSIPDDLAQVDLIFQHITDEFGVEPIGADNLFGLLPRRFIRHLLLPQPRFVAVGVQVSRDLRGAVAIEVHLEDQVDHLRFLRYHHELP